MYTSDLNDQSVISIQTPITEACVNVFVYTTSISSARTLYVNLGQDMKNKTEGENKKEESVIVHSAILRTYVRTYVSSISTVGWVDYYS